MDELKEKLFIQLSQSLEQLYGHYRELLLIVNEEVKILTGADLSAIAEHNLQKELKLVAIDAAEEARLRCVEEFRPLFPQLDPLRLLSIAEQYPPAQSLFLKRQHEQLMSIIKKVMEINQRSEALVHAALRNISGAMESVKTKLSGKPTYQRQGGLANNGLSAGRLVSKSV